MIFASVLRCSMFQVIQPSTLNLSYLHLDPEDEDPVLVFDGNKIALKGMKQKKKPT